MEKLYKDPHAFVKLLKEPEERPGFMLWQASNIWQRLMKLEVKEYDATYTQFIILCSLTYLSNKNEHVNQRLIAKHAKIDVMTVSDVLKTLVAKKMVTRTTNEKDRRHNYLKITEKGSMLVQNIFYNVRKADKKFFKVLGEEESKFNELLIKLIKGNYDDIYNEN